MKFDCSKCGENCKGLPFDVVIDGKKEAYCTDCYLQIKEEYAKKLSCEDCAYFEAESCEFEGKLSVVNIAGVDYFVQRERCVNFKDGSDPANAELKNEATRKRIDNEVAQKDVQTLVKELAKKNVTLTYYCCHCGVPLKIGVKNGLEKTCPSCKNDLTVIDMAKLIATNLNDS
jgi:hypothetical protein